MAFPLSRQRLVAVAMLLGLPLLTWYIWICLTFFGGALVLPASPADAVRLLRYIPAPTATAVLLYAAWLALQIGLHAVLPARERQGTPLAGGPALTYRLNGWTSFWATGLLTSGWWGIARQLNYFGDLLMGLRLVPDRRF